MADSGNIPPFNSATKTNTGTQSWQTTYSSDLDYFIYVANKNQKQTEVCLLHKNATSLNELPTHKNLYDFFGQVIIELNREKQTLEKDYFGFCRNVPTNSETYLKFGEFSTIVEYQDDSLVSYDFDWGNTNFTLLKEGEISSNVFVYWNETKWKFGANDSSMSEGELANFTYIINSTGTLYLDTEYGIIENETDSRDFYYPIFYNEKTEVADLKYNITRETYSFIDICSKEYSNCEWELIGNSAIINFVSDKYIDPEIGEDGLIRIIEAIHFDENKSFISDIFEEVSERDEIYSEVIDNNHTVRIKFEINLTRMKDITIYARGINNESNNISVYRKDDNRLLAKFYEVDEDSEYKIYLKKLDFEESLDTFDLVVEGQGVEFDYIIDPEGYYAISSYTDTVLPYSIAGIKSVFVLDDYAYALSYTHDSLVIFNITNKSEIIPLGNYSSDVPPYSIDGANELFVLDDFAYVLSDLDDSLTIFNVTNKSNPIPVGEYIDTVLPYSIENPYDIMVVGNYTYITSFTDKNFVIFNVTNKSNPVPIGNYTKDTAPYSMDGARGLDIVGDLAYVCASIDDSLTILNITNKSNPVPIGTYTYNSPPDSIDDCYELDTEGNYTYVTSYQDDYLTIINVTNPVGTLTAVGSYYDILPPNSIENAWDVQVVGELAYVTSYQDDSLTVINVTDKTNPVAMSSYTKDVNPDSIDAITGIFVLDNFVYATSTADHTLTIINVTEPPFDDVSPRVILNEPYNKVYGYKYPIVFNISVEDFLFYSCTYSLDNWITNNSISYNGTDIYAVNNSIESGDYTAKYSCNDSAGNINDTEEISFSVSPIGSIYPYDNYPDDNIIYSNENTFNLNYSTNNSMDICWYSHSYDANSTEVVAGTNWSDVNFLATGSINITVYCNISSDVSNTLYNYTVPFFRYFDFQATGDYINTLPPYSIDGANDIFVVDNFAYVVGNVDDSLTIINITDKVNPVGIGDYRSSVPPDSLDGAVSIFVLNEFAYTLSATDDYLSIFNITNKTNITFMSSYYDIESPHSIENPFEVIVIGDYAYITGSQDDSFTILNVSNKSDITTIGSYTYSVSPYSIDYANGFDVVGDLAYVCSQSDNELTILNITDRTNPVALGSYVDDALPYSVLYCYEVKTVGNYTYVTSSNSNSLTIINVTDPANPVGVGEYVDTTIPNSMNGAWALYIVDNYAFVTSNTDDTLTIINITEKTNPTTVGSYRDLDPPNSIEVPQGLFVLGDFAYVTSLVDDSLTIINVSILFPPVSTISLDIITPSNFNGINATQNQWFNITVNVTCNDLDCGEVNVSFDPLPTEDNLPHVPLRIDSIKWDITKTGDEEDLDIDYEIISDTQTEFCISMKNKTKYKEKKELKNKDIKNVPIEKIKGNSVIEKTKLDLDVLNNNEEECFLIYHPIDISGESFKIGWESVEIDGATLTTATAYSSTENICRTPDEILHVAYVGGGNDLWYGNSTDDGVTWTTKELVAGTFSNVGIVCMPNGSIMSYYIDTGVLYGVESGNGGESWGSAYAIGVGPSGFSSPSCVSDNNSNFHCSYVAGSSQAFYSNSTNLNNVSVNLNSADDSDFCNIEIGENNCVYIGCMGSDEDDLDFWSPCLNGWGDANRVELYDGTSVTGLSSGDGLSFDIVNDNIYVAFIDNSDLQFCNTTIASIVSNKTCIELDGTTSYHPSIGYSNGVDKVISIFYSDATTTTGNVVQINSTNNGLTWSTPYDIYATSSLPSIGSSSYPTSNRVTNMLRYVWTDSGSDVNYDNFSIDYTDPEYKSGLISTVVGDTPFYSNHSKGNPVNISLNAGETITIVFIVNATGVIGYNHTFFVYANKTSSPSISNMSSKWNVSIVAGAGAAPSSTLKTITQGIFTGNINDRISNKFRKLLQVLNFKSIIERIQSLFKTLTQSLKIDLIAERIKDLFQTITQSLNINSIAERIKDSLQTITQSLKIDSVVNRIQDSFKTLTQSLKIDTTVDRIVSLFKTVTQLTIIGTQSITDGINNLFQTITQSLKIDTAVNRLQSLFKTLTQSSNIDTSINRLQSLFKTLTQSLRIDNAVDRINNLFQTITQSLKIDTIANKIQGALQTITQSLKIDSVVNKIQSLFKTLTQQITIGTKVIKDNINNLFRTITQTLNIDTAVNKIQSLFKTLTQSLKIDSIVDRVRSVIVKINQDIGIESFVNKLSNFFRTVLQNIKLFLGINVGDSIPPTFDNLQNFTKPINWRFSETITASDNIAIDTYTLNDTSVFNISQTGEIINITNLSTVDIYWLNLSVNDTSNNIIRGIFYINVTDQITSNCGLISNNQITKSEEYSPYIQLCYGITFI